MNLDEWQVKAAANLKEVAGTIKQIGPGMLYGAMASAVLLPVVTATQQGDWGTLAALGGVVGAVAGNLVANQIQSWHDHTEQDLAAELAAKAKADPAWRQALDTLL